MSSPDVYDHFEARDAEIPDGIYRVVGRDEDGVTLLQVGDIDGRRVHTGEVVIVSIEMFDDLSPARNPDGNRSLGDILTSKFERWYWSVRVFVQQLVRNPLPTSLAVLLVLGGVFGDQFVSLSDVVFGGFILIGSLGLAYIGSGRLSI